MIEVLAGLFVGWLIWGRGEGRPRRWGAKPRKPTGRPTVPGTWVRPPMGGYQPTTSSTDPDDPPRGGSGVPPREVV